MSGADLLPCPFCGAEPPDVHLSHITGRIFCEGCGAEGPWSPAFDGDWNTRAHPVQEPPSPGVTAGATGGDAAERKRRKNIVDHYAQMMDAQAQCVPCRLCGGKAVITDAGPGFGYTIECENAARFRKPTCLQSGTRISGWAYNVSDLWNRLNATPAPVVPAEGLSNRRAYQVGYAAGQAAALRSAPPVGARVIAEKAYLAGFNAAGEGYNGEWPFHDKGISPDTDEGWLIGRDMAIAALLPAGEGEE